MQRAPILRLLAMACAVPLLLVSCGSDPEPSSAESPATSTSPADDSPASKTPKPSNGSTGALPTVQGGFGQEPKMAVPDADPPTELVVKTLSEGNGDAVESGETVVVDYLGARWADGATFDSSFGKSPLNFVVGAGGIIPGFDQGLVGQKAGSRVLLVIPPDLGYGDQPPADPIQAGDTLVFVVDILGSFSATDSARGKPTPTEDDGYPAVTILPKKPEIAVPPGDAPPKLIAIPVVTGKGPKVKSGDTVVVQYVGVLWRNGKQFDASWDRGAPFVTQIGAGAVIKGWDQGLVGQKVGSRVLLVVPSKLGYGQQGSGQIKAGDDLVFAIDILARFS